MPDCELLVRETSEEVKRLCNGLGITQSYLCRELNKRDEFRLTPAIVSDALSGKNGSPRARWVLNESLKLLLAEYHARRDMVDRAKRLPM